MNAKPKILELSGWLLLCLSLLFSTSFAATDVGFSAAEVGPRHMEPTLQQSIPRDYEKAWQTLQAALESGDATVLDQYWVGVAHDKFQRLVKDQGNTGVQVRYKNVSHNLNAVFYPSDGAALLLYDTVHLELQVLRSGKIIHSEDRTEKYLVLMTPAQDRWLVRVLQSVPQS